MLADHIAAGLQQHGLGRRRSETHTSPGGAHRSGGSGREPGSAAWGYVDEVLRHAGLSYEPLSVAQLDAALQQRTRLLLLVGDVALTDAQRTQLGDWVQQGGALIGLGGTSGLDELFGVTRGKPVMEGWIQVEDSAHPITAGLRSSLHVFGGCAVQPQAGKSLAVFQSGPQGAKGSAIVEHRCGKGVAVLLAADLMFSIVHLQQGLPVLQDAVPDAAGTAAVNDGELKAEDGLVLDWDRDRTVMEPDGVPIFLEPVCDELRTLVLRSIFHSAQTCGVTLPLLWYWPDKLPAVGHISHDTDGHDPQKAVALLEVLRKIDVQTTWCTLYPGGYPSEFYETLLQNGYEIALHYDARTGDKDTCWSKQNLLMQYRWLQETASVQEIVSNKNHYTRWESRLDFFRWCEEAGILTDQSRGPSKQGSIGFPLGGSHPYFPWDDEADQPRRLNVLEVNMLTQDLVVVCPAEYGHELIDAVLRQHGVAHFLFHPAHIQKPNVAEALSELVKYGRQQGLRWWTNQQIYRWEMARRAATLGLDASGSVLIRVGQPLRGATVLLVTPDPAAESVTVNGQPHPASTMQAHGFSFLACTLDL